MPKTVGVAVSNATFHFDKLYTYAVLPEHQDKVRLGSMVLVPFGRGSRARMGVVLACDAEPEHSKLKFLFDVAPASACLTPELLRLVHFLKERTFCTYYEAVKAVIPYGAQYKPTVAADGVTPVLQKQLVRHTENSYRLAGTLPQKPKPTAKQLAAVALLGGGPRTLTELEEKGISRAVLDNLCTKGVLECTKVNKSIDLYAPSRCRMSPLCSRRSSRPLMTRCCRSWRTRPAFGPAVWRDRQRQNAGILKAHCPVSGAGQTCAGAGAGDQPDTADDPAAQAAVWPSGGGAAFGPQPHRTSAAMADDPGRRCRHRGGHPQRDLLAAGKHRPDHRGRGAGTYLPFRVAPRYSAHEVARQRAAENGALLLLASATPSTESFYAARNGRTQLVRLTQRYGGNPLPTVQIVDMRAELASGNPREISLALEDAIRRNLEAKKQTILLLNRRGYQTMAQCEDCREVLKCSKCSVPMVYHKSAHKLLCHYCGSQMDPPPTVCPTCGGKLQYRGFGTQKAEEELAKLFPEARVLRMDQDSTAAKDAHEKLLAKFANHEYDIMVGTQMVAKGLDFEDVTLVGVLGIDSLLFAQGFRAYENVFSLITQVVGRSGRAKDPGFASSRPPTRTTRCSTLPPRRTTTPFSSRRSRTGNWACTRPSAGCVSSALPGQRKSKWPGPPPDSRHCWGSRRQNSPTCLCGCWALRRAALKRSTTATATSSPSSAATTDASVTLCAVRWTVMNRKNFRPRPPLRWTCIRTVISDNFWRYHLWQSATL